MRSGAALCVAAAYADNESKPQNNSDAAHDMILRHLRVVMLISVISKVAFMDNRDFNTSPGQ